MLFERLRADRIEGGMSSSRALVSITIIRETQQARPKPTARTRAKCLYYPPKYTTRGPAAHCQFQMSTRIDGLVGGKEILQLL